MPLFLEAAGCFLVLGLGDLGFAFSALHRPPAGDSAIPAYLVALAIMIVAGILWAIVNLRLRRAVTLNVVALVVAAGWLVLLFLSLTGNFVWYLRSWS